MKFISWNVNGLRACIQKGFLEQFQRLDADFFCLQETKLSAGQLKLDLPGYEQYWCYAEKKGYSGTAIFTKHSPLSVSYGIGREDLDNEGRVITLEYKEFYLVTCYTPNAQRGLTRIEHRMLWDEAFRSYLKNLDEVKPVILCGDLNVAHKEIDLKNPSSNRGNAGFSDEERESFRKTLDLGFTDTFRHLYPDATGRYSWWSYMFKARENNAGWRIDYFLVSDRLNNAIQKADIFSDIQGSDHCPVMLELDTLVNGAIWSPTAGTPSVIETPKPTKNAPKASPVNGKAFALFCLLLAFVLTLSGLPTLLAEANTDSTEPSTPANAPFTVHVLDQPFAKVPDYPVYLGFIPSDVEYYTDRLSDSDGLYFVEGFNEAYLTASNFWLRLELTDYGKENYSPDTVLHINSYTDLASSTITNHLVYYYAIPYYANVERTIIRGWLVWGMLEDDDTLMIFSLDDLSYSCTVYLEVIPPSVDDLIAPDDPIIELPAVPKDFLTLQFCYTPPKITHYNSNPLMSTLYPALVTSDNEIWPVDPSVDNIYEETVYNADFWLRIALTDEAIEYLAGKAVSLSYKPLVKPGSEPNNTLIPYYTDSTLTQVAGWFLFGDDATVSLSTLSLSWNINHYLYPDPLPITHFIREEEAAQMTTQALVSHILTNPGIYADLQSYLDDHLDEEYYSMLCAAYPAVAELDSREDAVSALMFYASDTDTEGCDYRYVATMLLSSETLMSRMTPSEEVQYILQDYPSCIYASYNTLVLTSLDLKRSSTETLVANMLLKCSLWETLLEQCSCYETREAMYRTLRLDNPIVRELETREDTQQVMMQLYPSDGSVSLITYLLELWPLMQELNGEVTISDFVS